MSNSLWPNEPQHSKLPRPSLSPRGSSSSCPLTQWCYLIISSSVAPTSPVLNLFQWVCSSHQVAEVLDLLSNLHFWENKINSFIYLGKYWFPEHVPTLPWTVASPSNFFYFSISPSNEYSGLISFKMGTGLISLQSKGLSRVFSNTIVQKHQFFGAQHSTWSNSHIPTWPLEKPVLWLYVPLLAKWYICFLTSCLGLS